MSGGGRPHGGAAIVPSVLREVPCPVCASTWRRRRYGDLSLCGQSTALFRCRGCGSGYISPRLVGHDLTRQYTDEADQERYYREMYAPIVPRLVAGMDLTMRLLEGFTRPGTLLDYGAGAAPVAAAAAKRGWGALGYDVSPVAARFGREALGTRVLTDWDEVAASPLAPFDAVAMIEVIEHVEDPRATVRHALSVLRPGGTLMVSTPNYASLARLARGSRWRMILPEGHILYFTPRSLRRVLRECGTRPLMTLTWWNLLGRLPGPRLWSRWLRDPPGGHGLLAFARKL